MKIRTASFFLIIFLNIHAVFSMPPPTETVEAASELVKKTIALLGLAVEAREAYDKMKGKFTTNPNGTDSDPWVTEALNGDATYARLAQLETEGFLNVNPNFRIRDNLNRVANQIKELNRVFKNEEDVETQLSGALVTVKGCLLRHTQPTLGNLPTTNNNPPVLVQTGRNVMSKEAADKCLSPFFQTVCQVLKTEKTNTIVTLPKADKSNLDEEASSWEWRVGLRASHFKIKDLQADPDGIKVRYGVRIRDNFNRMRNQMIEIQGNINEKIEEKTKHKETSTCLALVWNAILEKGTGYPTLDQTLFLNCWQDRSSPKSFT